MQAVARAILRCRRSARGRQGVGLGPHARSSTVAAGDPLSLALVAMFFVPRIPQDPAYHDFVDSRTLLGVPNFWNVFSNIGYLIVGLYGLARVSRLQAPVLQPGVHHLLCRGDVRCVRIFLVPLRADERVARVGSPADGGRLHGAGVSRAGGARVLATVACGALAARDHRCGDASCTGHGRRSRVSEISDPYALVQFLPVLLMPLLLLLFPGNEQSAMCSGGPSRATSWRRLPSNSMGAIYGAIGSSGHSIKHFVSSLAVLFAVFAML